MKFVFRWPIRGFAGGVLAHGALSMKALDSLGGVRVRDCVRLGSALLA